MGIDVLALVRVRRPNQAHIQEVHVCDGHRGSNCGFTKAMNQSLELLTYKIDVVPVARSVLVLSRVLLHPGQVL